MVRRKNTELLKFGKIPFFRVYAVLLFKNIDAQFGQSSSIIQLIQSILSEKVVYKAKEDQKKFIRL
jgi:hypothetical protein